MTNLPMATQVRAIENSVFVVQVCGPGRHCAPLRQKMTAVTARLL
jgi:hypothetical protein